MGRGSLKFAGALSLVLVSLLVAATALASRPVPKDGKYVTYATQDGATPSPEYLTISKRGRAVAFEINTSIDCDTGNGTLRTGVTFTSTESLNASGKAAPLAISNGRFSYRGPIFNVLSVTGEGHIAIRFKSPTKIAGTAQFSWPPSTLGPGIEGPCESTKLAFSGNLE
jgi:hypothetical protein